MKIIGIIIASLGAMSLAYGSYIMTNDIHLYWEAFYLGIFILILILIDGRSSNQIPFHVSKELEKRRSKYD